MNYCYFYFCLVCLFKFIWRIWVFFSCWIGTLLLTNTGCAISFLNNDDVLNQKVLIKRNERSTECNFRRKDIILTISSTVYCNISVICCCPGKYYFEVECKQTSFVVNPSVLQKKHSWVHSHTIPPHSNMQIDRQKHICDARNYYIRRLYCTSTYHTVKVML